MGYLFYRAVCATAMTIHAVHWGIAQAKPLAAIIQIVLVLVTGYTVGIVFRSGFLSMGKDGLRQEQDHNPKDYDANSQPFS
jgi:hypothetical protein